MFAAGPGAKRLNTARPDLRRPSATARRSGAAGSDTPYLHCSTAQIPVLRSLATQQYERLTFIEVGPWYPTNGKMSIDPPWHYLAWR